MRTLGLCGCNVQCGVGCEWLWGIIGVSVGIGVGESVPERRGEEEGGLTWVGVTTCIMGSRGRDMAMRRCRPWARRGCGAAVVICWALSDVVGVWRGVSGGSGCSRV